MKSSIVFLGVATVCLLGAAADAKDILKSYSGGSIKGTRGFEVEEKLRNDQAAFQVRVSVDRKDRTYAEGDLMTVTVRSTKSGYLYLIYKQVDGSTICLFPNEYERDNKIQAGKEVTLPTPNQGFQMRCRPPFGDELLVAIVTRKPLPVQQFGAKSLTADIVTDVNLGTLVESLKQGGPKGMGVEERSEPLKPGDYAEHTVHIKTVSRRGGGKPRPRRLGLFIGISQFQDERIPDLEICHQDAVEMERVMRKYGRLDGGAVLVNEQATLDNIRQAFRELKLNSRPGDEIFIYWSGHGATCADTGGDEKDGLDEYLMVHDGNLDNVEETMVLDDALGRWIQELDGRKVTVILDACHSGGQATDETDKNEKGLSGLKGRIIQDYRQKKTPKRGSSIKGDEKPPVAAPTPGDFLDSELRGIKDIGQSDAAMLFSSASDEISAERRDGNLSVMTYFLVEKITESDSLTLKGAYDHVKVEVPRYMEKHFPNRSQTPQLCPEGNASQIQLK